jgi:hypothetical protein
VEEGRGHWPAALQEDGATLVVRMRGPLDPAEVHHVCVTLGRLLARDRSRGVLCCMEGTPDVTVVGALARLHLLCRRLDVPVRLRADAALEELLEFTGLDAAVPARSEPVGKAEPLEQRGVEEVVHMGDAPG